MATVQIRDLPEPAYDILRTRARASGQSLQAYMRDLVIDLAFTPTKLEVLVEITASIERDGGLVVDQTSCDRPATTAGGDTDPAGSGR